VLVLNLFIPAVGSRRRVLAKGSQRLTRRRVPTRRIERVRAVLPAVCGIGIAALAGPKRHVELTQLVEAIHAGASRAVEVQKPSRRLWRSGRQAARERQRGILIQRQRTLPVRATDTGSCRTCR